MTRARTMIGVALLSAAVGYGLCAWWHRPDPRAVSRADSLQVALEALETQHVASEAQGAARADSISRLTLTVARLEARKPVVVGWVDTLVTHVPDTALADSLRGALVAERAISDSTANANKMIAALWQLRYTDASAERDQYRAVALECQRQLAAAVNVRRPGLLARAVSLAPWVAGAYLVGRVTR